MTERTIVARLPYGDGDEIVVSTFTSNGRPFVSMQRRGCISTDIVTAFFSSFSDQGVSATAEQLDGLIEALQAAKAALAREVA